MSSSGKSQQQQQAQQQQLQLQQQQRAQLAQQKGTSVVNTGVLSRPSRPFLLVVSLVDSLAYGLVRVSNFQLTVVLAHIYHPTKSVTFFRKCTLHT